MKAANTAETMETLLISTRYKEPTEDSTSTVNQRQNLVGLTVFLEHPATARPLAQLVEALRYKSEGRGLDSRLRH
jgi:hypothetical protein